MGRTVVAIVGLVCILSLANAMVTKGELEKDDWEFMEKFAFNNNGNGTLDFYALSPVTNLTLAVYTDVAWAKVYPNEATMSCEDKLAAASGVFPLRSESKVIFHSVNRPYYWFMAVASCGRKIDLKYNATLLNPGGYWRAQFSFDIQGLPEAYVFYFIMLFAYFVVHLFLCYRLSRGGNKLHTAIRMLTMALTFELVSCFCIMSHYLRYADNGVGSPPLKFIGQMLNIASQLTLLVLIMLLAKGWTIATTTLSPQDKKTIQVVFALFTLMYIILLFWETFGEDRAATTYFYSTVPGLLICALRSCLLVWFVITLRATYMKEPDWDKLKFYATFGVLYTMWLMALPLIVLIAFAIASWYRYKVVDALVLTFHFLGLSFMGFLLHPSKAQAVFSMSLPSVTYGDFAPYDEVL